MSNLNSGHPWKSLSYAEVAARSRKTIPTRSECYTTSRRFHCEYTWVIQNFDLCSNSESLTSPSFSAENDFYVWFLKIYRAWYYEEEDSWEEDPPSVPYLNLELHCTDAAAKKFGPASGNIELTLHLNNFEILMSKSEDFLTAEKEKSLQMSRFIRMDTIKWRLKQSSPPGTILIIRCKLQFILLNDIAHFSKQCSLLSLECEPNPTENFENLFNNEEDSDLTIYVDGKKYPAHKFILSLRSPVFKAMFAHGMLENKRNRIDINDIDEKIFTEMLRYMYTGEVENFETVVFELFLVADKYDITKLKIKCKSKLSQMISEDTVLKILLFSHIHSITDLKAAVIEYIQAHADRVIQSTSWNWRDLTSRPDLMKDVLVAYMK